MQVTDAYTAGFMDADGSFELRHHAGQFLVQCQASGTDRVVLDRLADLYGGHVYDKPSTGPQHKAAFIWRIAKRAETLAFLDRVEPYLTIKKTRARLLRFVLRWRPNYARLSLPERARLMACHDAMRSANHRGVGA